MKKKIFLKRAFCFFCVGLISFLFSEVTELIFLTEEARKELNSLLEQVIDFLGILPILSYSFFDFLLAYLFILWFEKKIKK